MEEYNEEDGRSFSEACLRESTGLRSLLSSSSSSYCSASGTRAGGATAAVAVARDDLVRCDADALDREDAVSTTLAVSAIAGSAVCVLISGAMSERADDAVTERVTLDRTEDAEGDAAGTGDRALPSCDPTVSTAPVLPCAPSRSSGRGRSCNDGAVEEATSECSEGLKTGDATTGMSSGRSGDGTAAARY